MMKDGKEGAPQMGFKNDLLQSHAILSQYNTEQMTWMFRKMGALEDTSSLPAAENLQNPTVVAGAVEKFMKIIKENKPNADGKSTSMDTMQQILDGVASESTTKKFMELNAPLDAESS